MNHLLKIAILNLALILLFANVYYCLPSNSFSLTHANQPARFIDFLYLSVTIQSTVGLPDIAAINDISKTCIIMQQLCMILSAFILFYYLRFM